MPRTIQIPFCGAGLFWEWYSCHKDHCWINFQSAWFRTSLELDYSDYVMLGLNGPSGVIQSFKTDLFPLFGADSGCFGGWCVEKCKIFWILTTQMQGWQNWGGHFFWKSVNKATRAPHFFEGIVCCAPPLFDTFCHPCNACQKCVSVLVHNAPMMNWSYRENYLSFIFLSADSH